MDKELLKGWSAEDLEELDSKFDALCEYLGIEFAYSRPQNQLIYD